MSTVTANRFVQGVKKHHVAYLFIAVPVLSTFVFLFIPMIISFWWSLNDYSGLQAARFVGLDNYIQLISKDTTFHKALLNTTLFVLMGMGIGPTLGLLTALMLNEPVEAARGVSHGLLPAGDDLAGRGRNDLAHPIQPERPA